MNKSYDIIGDIHGRDEALESVLAQLGYVETASGYKHPEGRQAVFLGDFIDRGTGNFRVLEIVRAMVDNGSAQAIMGNHEFNAICYATESQSGDGYLRPHSQKHYLQHKEFLDEFPLGTEKHEEMISWLKTLPVTIDVGEFRVVHACWDDESLDILEPYLDSNNCFKEGAYHLYGDETDPVYSAIESVLKSPEFKLPEDVNYTDARGASRDAARVLWWREKTLSNLERIDLRGTPLTSDQEDSINSASSLREEFMRVAKPTFVGHYYLHGDIEFSQDVAVLDYKDQVTAYRWDAGHKSFSRKNFIVG